MAAKTNMVKTSVRFLIPVKMLALKYNALVNLVIQGYSVSIIVSPMQLTAKCFKETMAFKPD